MTDRWDDDFEDDLSDDEGGDLSLSDDDLSLSDGDSEADAADDGVTESEYDGPPRSQAELEAQLRRHREAQRAEAEARREAAADAARLRAERDGDVPEDEALVLGVPVDTSLLREHTEFLREDLERRQAEGEDWMLNEGGAVEREPEPFDFFTLSDEDFADVVAAAKGAPVRRRSRLDDAQFGELINQFGPGARPGDEVEPVEPGEERF